MRFRIFPLVVFLFLGVGGLWAQTPDTHEAKPIPIQVQPQAGYPSLRKEDSPPVTGAPLNVPVFQFQLRAAFLLTPTMVAAIQSTKLSAQNSKSDQHSSSDKDSGPAWEAPILRDVRLASPLGIKIQGEQIVAVIVFMPIELAKQNLTMLVQNQVFARNPDSSIQMNTSMHTIRIPLGTLFYYYPLGGDSKQGAPVAIEILVNQK